MKSALRSECDVELNFQTYPIVGIGIENSKSPTGQKDKDEEGVVHPPQSSSGEKVECQERRADNDQCGHEVAMGYRDEVCVIDVLFAFEGNA